MIKAARIVFLYHVLSVCSQKFASSWDRIKENKRVVIHLPSLGLSQKIRDSIHDFGMRQNTQMARLCDIQGELKRRRFLWFSCCCRKDMIVFICYHKHTYTQTQTYRQTCIPQPQPCSLPPPSPVHTLCADWFWGWRTRCVLINWSVIYDNDDKDGWNLRQICNIYFLWLIKMRKLRWYVNWCVWFVFLWLINMNRNFRWFVKNCAWFSFVCILDKHEQKLS